MSTPEPALVPAKTFVESTLRLVRAYNDAAAALPSGDDFEYHSVFPGFAEVTADHAERLRRIEVTMMNIAVAPERQRRLFGGGAPAEGGAQPSGRSRLHDVAEMVFENIDTLLDSVKGAKMDADAQNSAFGGGVGAAGLGAETTNSGFVAADATRRGGVIGGAGVVVRPQTQFTRPPDNAPGRFRPLIFDAAAEGGFRRGEPGIHPFREVIESVVPVARMRDEQLPCALTAANLHLVATEADLDACISEHLTKAAEIAVDLEHHDLHSYLGITCLMQISTRTDDFLIDVFPLRDHLHRLNRVFLDPNITKVFHGCREDMRWLQKDFGCYVANLFDTAVALQALHLPHSLAYAVDHFCQIKLNKQYQRADWRVRPLPADMAHYARQDTHYLLYIYDRLVNRLLQQEGGRAAAVGNLLVHVLNESRQMALETYEKPLMNPDTTYAAELGKGLLGLSPAQLERARLVFNWRDAVARAEDESPLAVMHASAIVSLAVSHAFSATDLPTATGLLRAIHPVSMAARSNIRSLVEALAGAYPADEATSSAHGPRRRQQVNARTGEESGADRAHVQRRYAPMSGTLPSSVVDTVAAVVGPQASLGAVTTAPAAKGIALKPSHWAAFLGPVTTAAAAVSVALRAVRPPTVARLQTSGPAAGTAGAPKPFLSTLDRAIAESKRQGPAAAATPAEGPAAAEISEDGDKLMIPKRQRDEEVPLNGGEEPLALGAPSDEAPTAADGDHHDEDDNDDNAEKPAAGEAAKSLKDLYGLGRSQRKKRRAQ